MGYDIRCRELAQVFLSDVMPLSDAATRLSDELAQEIQDAIEGFISLNVPHTASKDCWCKPITEKP
jgi:hypothetical protein